MTPTLWLILRMPERTRSGDTLFLVFFGNSSYHYLHVTDLLVHGIREPFQLRELRTCSSATFVGDGQFDQPQLNGEQEEEEEDGEEEEEEEDSSELEDAAVETERKEEADDDDEEEVEVNDDEEADDDQAYALFSAGYFADSGDRSPPLQDDAGVHQLGAGSGDRADADSSSANIREQQSMSPLDDEDEEARTLGL